MSAMRIPVRLNILSDLHLSQGGLPLPAARADIVILAGDIARPLQGAQWAKRFSKPVIYVAGNHEAYGSSIRHSTVELKRQCAGTDVHVLDEDELVLQGIRFLGTTLWTDFMLFAEAQRREQSMQEGQKFMRDFSRIESDFNAGQKFTPLESRALFNHNRSWLQQKLLEPFDGPTVVVTHHAPSPKSIHPRFAGSILNACFVSDVEELMDGSLVALWVHGHTHDSFDYCMNGTRVVCNPRGYVKDNINENTLFNPDLVVDVDAGKP